MGIIESILDTGLVWSIPVTFAALGEVVNQKSGGINLSIQGVMVLSSFVSAYLGLLYGVQIGLLGGVISGLLMGLGLAFALAVVRTDQVTAGLAFWLVGIGLGDYLFKSIEPNFEQLSAINPVSIPLLSKIPIVGEALFNQDLLFYFAIFIITPILFFILRNTTYGLRIKTLGETPGAADTAGVNVNRYRFIILVFGCVMASLGGSYVSLAMTGFYQTGTIGGIGWIAFGLVFFSGWRVLWALGGSVLFGLIYATQLRLQIIFPNIPYAIFLALPYVVTLAVLVFRSAVYGISEPDSMTEPYFRE